MGEYAGPGWECKVCPYYNQEVTEDPPSSGNYECTCQSGFVAAGYGCVADADKTELDGVVQGGGLTAAYSLTYRSLVGPESEAGIESDVFAYYFAQAALGCKKHQQPEQCQTLANLCVLALYDHEHPICAYLRDNIAEGEYLNEFSLSVPWIEFSGEDIGSTATILGQVINDAGYDIEARMEVQGAQTDPEASYTHLDFMLAQYDINGTFLGYTELAEQFFICPASFNDVENMRSFGT